MTLQEYIQKNFQLSIDDYRAQIIFVLAYKRDEADRKKLEQLRDLPVDQDIDSDTEKQIEIALTNFTREWALGEKYTPKEQGELNVSAFVKIYETYYGFQEHKIRDMLLIEYFDAIYDKDTEKYNRIANVLFHSVLWPHKTLQGPEHVMLIHGTFNRMSYYDNNLHLAASFYDMAFDTHHDLDRHLVELYIADLLYEYKFSHGTNDTVGLLENKEKLKKLFKNNTDSDDVKNLIETTLYYTLHDVRCLPVVAGLDSRQRPYLDGISLLKIWATKNTFHVSYDPEKKVHTLEKKNISEYQTLDSYLKKNGISRHQNNLQASLLFGFNVTEEQQMAANVISGLTDEFINKTSSDLSAAEQKQLISEALSNFDKQFENFMSQITHSELFMNLYIEHGPLLQSLKNDLGLKKNLNLELAILNYIDKSLGNTDLDELQSSKLFIVNNLLTCSQLTSIRQIKKIETAIDCYIKSRRMAAHLLTHFFDMTDVGEDFSKVKAVLLMTDFVQQYYYGNTVMAAKKIQQFVDQKLPLVDAEKFCIAIYNTLNIYHLGLRPPQKLPISRKVNFLNFDEGQFTYQATSHIEFHYDENVFSPQIKTSIDEAFFDQLEKSVNTPSEPQNNSKSNHAHHTISLSDIFPDQSIEEITDEIYNMADGQEDPSQQTNINDDIRAIDRLIMSSYHDNGMDRAILEEMFGLHDSSDDDETDSENDNNTDSEGPQNCLTDVNIPPVSKDIFRIVPVTPEERLADYNRQLLEQRKAQADQALQELLQQKHAQKHTGRQQYFIYAPQITQPHHIPVMNSQQLQLGQNNMVTLRATGTDAFTTTQSTSRGSGSHRPTFRVVRTPIVDSQAPILRGPGSVHPVLSTGGRVAGAYIGVFMMAPQIYRDGQVILSPRTTKAQKGAAVFDLTKMGVGVWAFGKFVMKKHPQVGAGIMMGTAAYHGAESIEHYLLRPYLQKAEFGQTGQRMIFNNEEDYFNNRPLGPSCTDGRQVLFLQNKASLNKSYFFKIKK